MTLKKSAIRNVFIPNDWDEVKFRQVFWFGKGLSITKDDLVEEGIPVVSYGQIHAKANSGTGLTDDLYRYVPEKYLRTGKNCIVKRNDFVFADTSEDYAGIGNCVFIDRDDLIFAGYHSIIARPIRQDIYPKYFAYLFLSNCWRDQIRANVMGIKVFSITQKLLRDTYVIIPPLDEQRAIATFLDAECAKIDSIIDDLEKQLEVLKKLKKSIITQAVIKGINTAVSMKDSGVEWIGQIPRHWAISRLKYCCKVKTGPFGTQLSADEYTDGGTPIINVKNIGYGTVNEDDLDRIPDSVKMRLSTHILRKGDIVFGRKGAVDKHAIIDSEHDGWVQGSDCIRIRVEREIESSFLNYYFESSGYGDYVVVNSVGSTMASINSDILNNSVVVFPDMQEQLNIVEYLNERTKLVNSLIAGKEKQLVQIRNHRKALIYEYVTGKKRVMEVTSHAN